MGDIIHDPRQIDIEDAISSNTGRVFVVQHTDLNLAKATRFGQLTPLITRGVNITLQPHPVIQELDEKLRDFTDNDYILPVGDPIAIGLAFWWAARNNHGRVKVLKWDRELNDYYAVAVDANDRG